MDTHQPAIEHLTPDYSNVCWYISKYSPDDHLLLAVGFTGGYGTEIADLAITADLYVFDAWTGKQMKMFSGPGLVVGWQAGRWWHLSR